MQSDRAVRVNRLAQEKSPYLLQHAHNPVDWYPWGDEAFARARTLNRPIFLSIGYSTCHWCHVMERESFEDAEVGALLNQHFVSIKVDREERPDVDQIYMSACQALTGRGGWPLTVFLTPDKEPFFAGTYFPKRNHLGMTGLMELLHIVNERWQRSPEQIMRAALEIKQALERRRPRVGGGAVDIACLHQVYRHLESQFDDRYGGFGPAPKFPMSHYLLFLLRYAALTGETQALAMVEKTLRAMQQGGIYDHLGFGFSRYSTDGRWLVPHFEKMLYDNALLALAYAECYQATGDPWYARITREIFTYVLRDMTHSEGAFFSAEDADSEGVEGKFYVWRPEEILEVLGEALGQQFCQWYDVTSEGNFEHGYSILHRVDAPERPLHLSYDAETWEERLTSARQRLWKVREERVHPYKDDKILTFWNGLMIAALARAGRILGENSYTSAARQAMEFLWTRLRDQAGRWHVRYRQEELGPAAFLDDYAAVVWGLLELHEADGQPLHLARALTVQEEQEALFADAQEGGFFFSAHDAEELLSRPKDIYDGATPSGNSMTALNLIRLFHLTGDVRWQQAYERLLSAFSRELAAFPAGSGFCMLSLFFRHGPSQQAVIIPGDDWEEVQGCLKPLARRFLPFTSWMVLLPEQREQWQALAPFTASMQAVGGRTTFYVCRDFACEAPLTQVDEFLQLLSPSPSGAGLPETQAKSPPRGMNADGSMTKEGTDGS